MENERDLELADRELQYERIQDCATRVYTVLRKRTFSGEVPVGLTRPELLELSAAIALELARKERGKA